MRNFYSHSLILSVSTIAILIVLSFIPQINLGVFSLKATSITSDVAPTKEIINQIIPGLFNTADTTQTTHTAHIANDEVNIDTTAIIIAEKTITPQESINEKPVSKITSKPKETIQKKTTPSKKTHNASPKYKKIDSLSIATSDKTKLVIKPIYLRHTTAVIPIENSNNPNFKRFLSELRAKPQTRIAIAGDSYIEGDILSQDIRANLQTMYGGEGVGFLPISSPITGFRRSVKHSFNGWSSINVLNRSRSNHYLNGYIFYPSEGAWVKYSGTTYRPHLSSFTQAKLMFINTGKTKIKATVNGKYDTVFTPKSSDKLQVITIQDTMQNIRFSFTNVNGFSAYGAMLESESGILVDNHSVRSYSGLALANLRTKLMSEAQNSHYVDLVILQYGLNAVNIGTSKYAGQLYNIINRIKAVMPGTAILVMSIGDGEERVSGKWQTKKQVLQMEAMQRAVALKCNVAFWSTMQAAQKHGGIHSFVKNGWAAKDYLHLSPKGGTVLATMLTDAIQQSEKSNQ